MIYYATKLRISSLNRLKKGQKVAFRQEKCTFLKKNAKKLVKNLEERKKVTTFATANKKQHLFSKRKCFNSSVG